MRSRMSTNIEGDYGTPIYERHYVLLIEKGA